MRTGHSIIVLVSKTYFRRQKREQQPSDRETEGAATPEASGHARSHKSGAVAGMPMFLGSQQSRGEHTELDRALDGVSGDGEQLPQRALLEDAFGVDLGAVRMHVGGKAAGASSALGAQAYAAGSSLAFRERPSLFTLAHEVSHVLQQEAGLVGQERFGGKQHETTADEAARAVVRGQKAGPHLGQAAGVRPTGAAASSVQRLDALADTDENTPWHNTQASSETTGQNYRFSNAELERQMGSEDGPAEARNSAVDTYVENIANTAFTEDQPRVLPAYVGYPSYYLKRYQDHVRRNGGSPAPPSYYLDYGYKYARRFTDDLFPRLSGQGKRWLIKTRTNLQLAMENAILRDPEAFAQLENDDDAFMDFAYDSHPAAYLDAGLKWLSMSDLMEIGTTPDFSDLFTTDGLSQVMDVFPDVMDGLWQNNTYEIRRGFHELNTNPNAWYYLFGGY